jgi:hypothetical protein
MEVPMVAVLGESASVAGVTENEAEDKNVLPKATSTKYPPPSTSGTVSVIPPGMAPAAVVVNDVEPPAMLHEPALAEKQSV